MVVVHQKKCIYTHIPKTAGTSIEQFLTEKGKNELSYRGVRGNRSMHHFTALDFMYEIPFYFKSYYKFSIVRNPYDRLLSEYYWCKIPGVGYKSGKTKAEFLDYVTSVVKNKLYYSNIFNDHFIPQHIFLYQGKKLLVDNLFKYEDLDWTVQYLKKKLNIENDLPHLNKSNKNIIKEDWNERQKNRIYNLYKKDFLIFNYQK